MSNVEDREAAVKELRGLIDLINRTWERRGEIEPDRQTHHRPTPMAVYKLHPGTNCKACGEPTCFTFALKLAASHRGLEDCPALARPEHKDRLERLRAIVTDAPRIGP